MAKFGRHADAPHDAPLLRLLRQEGASPPVAVDSPPGTVGAGVSTARYDDKGRFLAVCAVCGQANASFGYGCTKHNLGRWYCREHRPHG